MHAAESGHCHIVELLLDGGAYINQQSVDGSTALILASDLGHHALVAVLVERHAKLDLLNKAGVCATMKAYLAGHYDIMHFLLQNGANANNQDKVSKPKSIIFYG